MTIPAIWIMCLGGLLPQLGPDLLKKDPLEKNFWQIVEDTDKLIDQSKEFTLKHAKDILEMDTLIGQFEQQADSFRSKGDEKKAKDYDRRCSFCKEMQKSSAAHSIEMIAKSIDICEEDKYFYKLLGDDKKIKNKEALIKRLKEMQAKLIERFPPVPEKKP
jgi:hypothetical protein